MTKISSGFVLGVVIFTGGETKTQVVRKIPYLGGKNANNDHSTIPNRGIFKPKRAKVDHEINKIVKQLFLAFSILAIGISAVGKRNDVLSYTRHLLLLLCILPVCVRINIDLSKIYFTYLVKNDKDIIKAYVRNPSVIENLGRIDFLITDKTGTLTKK